MHQVSPATYTIFWEKLNVQRKNDENLCICFVFLDREHSRAATNRAAHKTANRAAHKTASRAAHKTANRAAHKTANRAAH